MFIIERIFFINPNSVLRGFKSTKMYVWQVESFNTEKNDPLHGCIEVKLKYISFTFRAETLITIYIFSDQKCL